MPPGAIPLEELLAPAHLARLDRLAAHRGVSREEMAERLTLVGLAALEDGWRPTSSRRAGGGVGSDAVRLEGAAGRRRCDSRGVGSLS